MDEEVKLLIVGDENVLPIDLETPLFAVLQDCELRCVGGEGKTATKRQTFTWACPALPFGATGNEARGREMAGHRREINLQRLERRWFRAVVTPQETL